MKALALPDYIRTLPYADPMIVPSAGIVLAIAMLKSYFLEVSQLYCTFQRGVQTFIYWPDVAAIIVSDITVRNLKISLRQGEWIDMLASSAVLPLTRCSFSISV